jgi:hypothetical protein
MSAKVSISSSPPPSPLYPRLIGTAWHELAECVRLLHDGGRIICAAGTFCVHQAQPLLARLARMPVAGERVPLRLVITPIDNGEVWHRTFAGKPLVSQQWARPDGLLVERMGPLELRFRLTGQAGALCYRSVGRLDGTDDR